MTEMFHKNYSLSIIVAVFFLLIVLVLHPLNIKKHEESLCFI